MESNPPAFSVFNFDRMITPTIIRVLYFLSCALVIIGGLGALLGAVVQLTSAPWRASWASWWSSSAS